MGSSQDPFNAYNFRLMFIPDFNFGSGLAGTLTEAVAGAVAGIAMNALLGSAISGFTSVKGMHWQTESRTVRAGGINDREYQLPGRTTCKDLVFSKGVCALDPMWTWYEATMSGYVLRMNGLISLMSSEGATLTTWYFTHAWPKELAGVELDASQSLLAVQHMTLAIGSIRRFP